MGVRHLTAGRFGAILGAGVLLAASPALAGCGDDDNTAGGPIPSQREGETYPGPRSDETVSVELTDKGCWFVTLDGARRVAVWPAGTEQSRSDGSIVVLPGGAEVVDGDQLDVSAGVFPVKSLVGYPDGYWGTQLVFCDPSGTEVLVMDSATVRT